MIAWLALIGADDAPKVVSVPTSRPMAEVTLCLAHTFDPFVSPSILQMADRIVVHYGRGVRDVTIYPDRIETAKKLGHLPEKELAKCAVEADR